MAHLGIRLGIFLLLNEDEWFLPNHRAKSKLGQDVVRPEVGNPCLFPWRSKRLGWTSL